MTSRPIRKTPATRSADRFPEFPPRDDVQNSLHLDQPALQAALSHHFGMPDTTIILSEVPIGRTVRQRQGLRVPDLLVAFGVDTPASSTGTAIPSRSRANRRTSCWKWRP